MARLPFAHRTLAHRAAAPAATTGYATEWDAVILAGGRGSRLGGIDKALLGADGTTLLERALLATAPAGSVVVVGRGNHDAPAEGTDRLRFADESPAFGGPAAAVAAGLAAIEAPSAWTVLLAGDLPGVRSAVPFLLAARPNGAVDGVVATDPDGRRQPLLGCYRTSALREAVRRIDVNGASVRELLEPLTLATVGFPHALCADVDTPADAERHGLAALSRAR